MKGHPLFRSVWVIQNVLLTLSAALFLGGLFWEHSTREYLRGFADAVIPASGSNLEKVQSILDWMRAGPSRRSEIDPHLFSDRNPEETLNYRSLLRVCGSATNAFINLALSERIGVRRLLLLNTQGAASHVDAEVLLDGRWIVVDPVFRRVMRGPSGLLTAQQLKDPELLKSATEGLSGYRSEYSFANTGHLHMARFGKFGVIVAWFGDVLFRGWDQSEFATLIAERASFAFCVLFLVLLLFFLFSHSLLAWYADKRLGVHRVHFVERLRRGREAFLRHAN